MTHIMSIAEAGLRLIVHDNDGMEKITEAKEVLEVGGERKGKCSDRIVCEVSAPILKARRTYVKHNMEYWNSKQGVLNITGKQVRVQMDV